MKYIDIFKFVVEEIHTVVFSTINELGLPVTCAIDLMDYDETGLYFLTSTSKEFYGRLMKKKYIAFTGITGDDTLSMISVSLMGNVVNIGIDKIEYLFEKNNYMQQIYPSIESCKSLTVFKIDSGDIHWYDLSKKPIEQMSFTFGKLIN